MPFASSRLQVLAAATAVLTTITIAPLARATPETDAKDLFQRGRELRESNDCGSAASLFRKAWERYPQALGPLRNLAECEEQLGHFASSRRAWLDLKRSLITSPDDVKYKGWDGDAEEAAARLKPKVATFVVDVYVKSTEGEALANDKSGVEIFVNGESVGTTLVGTPLERDPAPYRIRAQLTDAQPVEQIVSLSAGDNPHVTIRLTVDPKPKPVARAATQSHSGRRTAGIIVAGVGAAALIGSGVTFLLKNGKSSDLDDQCPSHVDCDPSLRDTVDGGKTMATLTNILFPVGLVGLAVGGVLFFTSRPASGPAAEPAKAARATVRVVPTLGGINLSGSF